MDTEKFKPKKHPIQLRRLRVIRLRADLHNPDAEFPKLGLGAEQFSLEVGVGRFVESDSTISILLGLTVGSEEGMKTANDLPVFLNIEIAGLFSVDASAFKVSDLEDWAQRNAALALYPFLREQAYSLASRLGISELLLPMLEIPTYKFAKSVEHSVE